MKISNIIYGVVIIVAVVAIIFSFQSNLVVSYNKELPTEYNETFQILTSMKNITDETDTYKQKALNTNTSENPVSQFFDVIGRYYERGFKTVELVPRIMNLFDTMAQSLIGSNVAILGIAVKPVTFLVLTGMTLIIVFLFIEILLRYKI